MDGAVTMFSLFVVKGYTTSVTLSPTPEVPTRSCDNVSLVVINLYYCPPDLKFPHMELS